MVDPYFHHHPPKRKKINLREILCPSLDGMTLSGGGEPTEPVNPPELRGCSRSLDALQGSSLVWNESHKLVSNILENTSSKRLEPVGLVLR